MTNWTDVKISFDPAGKKDVVIVGEGGLELLVNLIKQSWANGDELIIYAKRVVFKRQP